MMNNKPGFLYLALSTAFLAVQFLLFIKGNAALSMMDFTGWVFYVTSCVSHAACFTLIPFLLVYLPLSALRHWRIGGALMITVLSLVSVLIFLDMQVYDIYRFHINGFILNMVFSSGASEIFAFDALLYLKEFGLFAVFVAVHVAFCLPMGQTVHQAPGMDGSGRDDRSHALRSLLSCLLVVPSADICHEESPTVALLFSHYCL